MLKRVLDTVLKNGAEIAEPGEFTKRAFLNGRMDLSQAEGCYGCYTGEKMNMRFCSSMDQLRVLCRKQSEISEKS